MNHPPNVIMFQSKCSYEPLLSYDNPKRFYKNKRIEHLIRIIFEDLNVRGLFGVRVCQIAVLTDKELHSRMRNTLGTITSWFLVFYVGVPECSWNGSGKCPHLWVQEKFVEFRQSSQDAGLCPAEFLGQFFNDPTFNRLRKLPDVFLSNSRNGRVPSMAVPRCSCWVCLETAANFCLFLNVAIFLRAKCSIVAKTE